MLMSFLEVIFTFGPLYTFQAKNVYCLNFWPELYMEAQMQKSLLEMTLACLKTYETIYNMLLGQI